MFLRWNNRIPACFETHQCYQAKSLAGWNSSHPHGDFWRWTWPTIYTAQGSVSIVFFMIPLLCLAVSIPIFCSGSQNHNVSQICRVKRTKTHIDTERLKIKPDLTDLFQPKLFRGPKKGDNYWDSRKVSKDNIQFSLYYEAWAFKNEIWVRRLVIVTSEFEIIWKVFESLFIWGMVVLCASTGAVRDQNVEGCMQKPSAPCCIIQ